MVRCQSSRVLATPIWSSTSIMGRRGVAVTALGGVGTRGGGGCCCAQTSLVTTTAANRAAALFASCMNVSFPLRGLKLDEADNNSDARLFGNMAYLSRFL